MAGEDTLFPIFEDIEEVEFLDGDPAQDILLDEIVEEEPLPLGFTWKFDFNKGDIEVSDRGQFKLVEDMDTLHEWVGHTLNTERFETPIFGGDIGISINSLIGQRVVDSQVVGEIEQDIQEAILVHDRIDFLEIIATFPLGYDVYVAMRYSTDEGIARDEIVEL